MAYSQVVVGAMSFRVLCADPAWDFEDKLPGNTRGAASNYDVMSVDDICKLDLPPLEDNAILFLWRVSSQVEEAYRVVRAWGFVPKSEIVWEKLTRKGKPHFGMGRYVRGSHESCIVATRGRLKVLSRSIRSRFSAPVGTRPRSAERRAGVQHSEKPEFFYREIVEKLSAGPYCELFARKQRDGWTCLGNQVGLLGAA
jgi:N6-adenosine-specific RNA methylase IME4